MTGAIIILYHPDTALLEQALERLIPQVDEVCLIDNSDISLADHFEGRKGIVYVPLLQNMGIAAAQNRGICHFREKGYDDVLFCDQDSRGTAHLVERLKAIRSVLEQQGHRIAAIGPKPINEKTGRSYYNKPRNVIRQLTVDTNGEAYHVDLVHSIISSFSLVRLAAFDEVGLFEEPLFIDAVDNEWGWRAEHFHSMRSFMVHELTFSHMQGQPTRMPFKKSSAFRLYYQYRNFLVLLRRPYVPFFWKWHCMWTYLLKFFFYPLFVSPRWQNLCQMLRGIRDGLFRAWPSTFSTLSSCKPSPGDQHSVALERQQQSPLPASTISVLMSVYGKDEPSFLSEAMQSIWTEQTRRPDQIVLIEDGPLPAALLEVIDQWKKEIGQPLEVYSNEQNMGLTHSLNKGLEKTKGTLIARMDSDDRSHPKRFERQEQFLQEHPEVDILGGSMQEFDETEECLNIRHYPTSPEAARAMIHRASPVAHPTVMMRRRLFATPADNSLRESGKPFLRYDERYRISQDIALWFDAVCSGYQISNITDITLFFRRANDVYKRRGRVKAWNEFKIYMRGIYRLYGLFTPKYAYPIMRLVFRLMPRRIVRWGYDSRLRRHIAEKKG